MIPHRPEMCSAVQYWVSTSDLHSLGLNSLSKQRVTVTPSIRRGYSCFLDSQRALYVTRPVGRVLCSALSDLGRLRRYER
jgi:hypothetical protein